MANENKLSLGEFLRQEREKKGMTIEQVASATKINVRLLHALEADQYKDLPAKPFIRGFVTSYARFVGIDPREILTQFTSYIDTRSHDRPGRESGHSGYVFERREGDQNSRVILGATMGVFALAGVILLVMKPSLHHRSSHLDKLKTATPQSSPSVGPSESPTAEKPAEGEIAATPAPAIAPLVSPTASPSTVAVAVVPSITPSTTPSPTPSPFSSPEATRAASADDPHNSGLNLKNNEVIHKVKFKALDSVWVRYQVDDRPMMQFILRQGKMLVLRAQKVIKFQVSNPAQIQFSYNGANTSVASESKLKVKRQNDATYIFPPALAEGIQEPFPNSRPLFSKAVPKSPTPVASPIPTSSPAL